MPGTVRVARHDPYPHGSSKGLSANLRVKNEHIDMEVREWVRDQPRKEASQEECLQQSLLSYIFL